MDLAYFKASYGGSIADTVVNFYSTISQSNLLCMVQFKRVLVWHGLPSFFYLMTLCAIATVNFFYKDKTKDYVSQRSLYDKAIICLVECNTNFFPKHFNNFFLKKRSLISKLSIRLQTKVSIEEFVRKFLCKTQPYTFFSGNLKTSYLPLDPVCDLGYYVNTKMFISKSLGTGNAKRSIRLLHELLYGGCII